MTVLSYHNIQHMRYTGELLNGLTIKWRDVMFTNGFLIFKGLSMLIILYNRMEIPNIPNDAPRKMWSNP